MSLHLDSPDPGQSTYNTEATDIAEFHPENRGDFSIETSTAANTIKIERTVPLGNTKVDYTYEGPAVALENIEYLFPFFSGFGGIKVSSRPLSEAMARRGLGMLTIDPIRKDDRSNKERLFNPHAIQIEAMEAAINNLRDKEGLDSGAQPAQLIPIAHSMGGEASVGFAERYHGQTAAVILLATIGFGSPRLRYMWHQLPRGAISGISEELIPFLKHNAVPKSIAAAAQSIGYFVVNPLRTCGEIGSCLTSDLTERSQALAEQGIPIIYGQPVFDVLVRGGKRAADHVSVVSDIDHAGHLFLQAKPERAAEWIMHSLQTLELVDS